KRCAARAARRRRGAQDVLEHGDSESARRLAFLDEVEAEIEVILGLEILVATQTSDEMLLVVVDEGADDLEAEVLLASRRRDLLRPDLDERDREEVAPFRGDQMVIPEEPQIIDHALPSLPRPAGLERARDLIDSFAERIRV